MIKINFNDLLFFLYYNKYLMNENKYVLYNKNNKKLELVDNDDVFNKLYY